MCKEDTSSSENLSHLSSLIFENTEGEDHYFSSIPLHDSSDHEDVNEHPKFFIVVVMIYVLLHLIMMLTHSLLILVSHWSSMIYLLTKWTGR